MGKTVKLILIMLIIVASVFTMTSCAKDKEVVAIDVIDGCVKSTFDVDETIDVSAVRIVIKYANGKEKTVADGIEIKGFDSSTTGHKTMEIWYNGEKVSDFAYDVVYSIMPSQQIVTTARIGLTQRPYQTGISRQIDVKVGNLDKIEAIYFTLESNVKLVDANQIDTYECEMLLSGWDIRTTKVGDRALKVIAFRKGGTLLDTDKAVLAVNFFGDNASQAISLKNVAITDGVQEYVIPPTATV